MNRKFSLFALFFLTLLLVDLVSATERLTTQVEPSYPSPTMMKVYNIERIVFSPIITPLGYAVDTTHEFTKLSYGRTRRFFSPVKPEAKILDKSILEKAKSDSNTLIKVDIDFYDPPMKYEENILKSFSSDVRFSLGNGVNGAHATILPADAIKIASLPSVRGVMIHTYPCADC